MKYYFLEENDKAKLEYIRTLLKSYNVQYNEDEEAVIIINRLLDSDTFLDRIIAKFFSAGPDNNGVFFKSNEAHYYISDFYTNVIVLKNRLKSIF